VLRYWKFNARNCIPGIVSTNVTKDETPTWEEIFPKDIQECKTLEMESQISLRRFSDPRLKKRSRTYSMSGWPGAVDCCKKVDEENTKHEKFKFVNKNVIIMGGEIPPRYELEQIKYLFPATPETEFDQEAFGLEKLSLGDLKRLENDGKLNLKKGKDKVKCGYLNMKSGEGDSLTPIERLFKSKGFLSK